MIIKNMKWKTSLVLSLCYLITTLEAENLKYLGYGISIITNTHCHQDNKFIIETTRKQIVFSNVEYCAHHTESTLTQKTQNPSKNHVKYFPKNHKIDNISVQYFRPMDLIRWIQVWICDILCIYVIHIYYYLKYIQEYPIGHMNFWSPYKGWRRIRFLWYFPWDTKGFPVQFWQWGTRLKG